jgi:hypothetical protein
VKADVTGYSLSRGGKLRRKQGGSVEEDEEWEAGRT